MTQARYINDLSCIIIALSTDNTRGGEIYKFDMSLMERLYTSEFPMSLLTMQRRMRPTISTLIRYALGFSVIFQI